MKTRRDVCPICLAPSKSQLHSQPEDGRHPFVVHKCTVCGIFRVEIDAEPDYKRQDGPLGTLGSPQRQNGSRWVKTNRRLIGPKPSILRLADVAALAQGETPRRFIGA
jgi:hypothetical protein